MNKIAYLKRKSERHEARVANTSHSIDSSRLIFADGALLPWDELSRNPF